VTDADVLLGYLNDQHLLAGDFPIDVEKARKAVNDNVASPLGLPEIEAAHGVHLLVNSNMGRALRAVSSERGRDPRRFTLIAFGGGGPVHAAGLAEMLDITQIIVPPFPGVFSSFGLLFADVEHHFVQTYFKTFQELDIDTLNNILEGLWEEGRKQLRLEGFGDDSHEVLTQVDMKYEGQVSELTVWMPPGRVTTENLKKLTDSFDEEHEKTYGYRTDSPYQLVNLRVLARGLSSESRVPESIELPPSSLQGRESRRKVYFGPERGWFDTPVLDRTMLSTTGRAGPLIIEEYDSTSVVPPGWKAGIDDWKNIIMDRE
jgi:N-methylhydantoinase A